MTTALDIVTQASRKKGILARGERLEAEAAADGIFALNAMMHAWQLAGINTTHSDLSLDDLFPLGPQFIEGTVYLLASRMAPEYTVPQSFDADDWFRKFQAAYLVITPVAMPEFDRMQSYYAGGKRERFF